jgi:hypothetical protein
VAATAANRNANQKTAAAAPGPASMKVRLMVINGARLMPSVYRCGLQRRAASATSSAYIWLLTLTPLLNSLASPTRPATEPSIDQHDAGGTS